MLACVTDACATGELIDAFHINLLRERQEERRALSPGRKYRKRGLPRPRERAPDPVVKEEDRDLPVYIPSSGSESETRERNHRSASAKAGLALRETPVKAPSSKRAF